MKITILFIYKPVHIPSVTVMTQHSLPVCVCVCTFTNLEQAKPAVEADRPQG